MPTSAERVLSIVDGLADEAVTFTSDLIRIPTVNPPGEAYDIPLRCLMPRGAEGLVVAGRCISGTHEAHSSYRVMPIVMATGHAAGICAAIAARDGTPPRAVPARQVQRELIRQKASLRRDVVENATEIVI